MPNHDRYLEGDYLLLCLADVVLVSHQGVAVLVRHVDVQLVPEQEVDLGLVSALDADFAQVHGGGCLFGCSR